MLLSHWARRGIERVTGVAKLVTSRIGLEKDELLKEKDELLLLKEIQLAEALMTLATIQSSPAWKAITVYRAALCNYFPTGSMRRRSLDAMFRQLFRILRGVFPSLISSLDQPRYQAVVDSEHATESTGCRSGETVRGRKTP